MRELPLSKGQTALVDAADFAYLNQWKWSVNSHGFAVRVFRMFGRQYARYLHHELMPDYTRNKIHVTHINRIKTDCRRENLRYRGQKGHIPINHV